MNSTNDHIDLCDASISEVSDICDTVKTRNSQNEISVNMAKGIADFVETNGYVSEKQACWIVRNADYWKISRPFELKDVVWDTKVAPLVKAATKGVTEDDEILDALKAILGAVQRVERSLVAR
jgi:hypothetical protein